MASISNHDSPYVGPEYSKDEGVETDKQTNTPITTDFVKTKVADAAQAAISPEELAKKVSFQGPESQESEKVHQRAMSELAPAESSAYVSPETAYVQEGEIVFSAPSQPLAVQAQKANLVALLGQELIITSNLEGPKKGYAPTVQRYLQGLKAEELSHLESLGSGHFKTTFKTYITTRNKLNEYTVKPVAVAAMQTPQEDKDGIVNAIQREKEMLILTAKQHIPGVLPNYGMMTTPHNEDFVVVTKFCNKGSVKNGFGEVGQTMQQRYTIIKNCWEALSQFHAAGFTHRDVKASNFLLHETQNKQIKSYVGDLGLACASNSKSREGRWKNMSVLPPFARTATQGMLSDPKIDTWAFGLMICNIMRAPHEGLAFDCDEEELAKSAIVQKWLDRSLSVAKAQDKVREFIDETFEKAPFSDNQDVNAACRLLVMQMMGASLDEIPDDAEITKAFAAIEKKIYT